MTGSAAPMIAVLLHDGFYGCGTGAGYANRNLLEQLIDQAPAGTRFLVLPVHLHPRSGEYDGQWHQCTQQLLARAHHHTVVPLDNGTHSAARFGGLAAFRQLARHAGRILTSHTTGAASRRSLRIVALDVPFLGLATTLPPDLIPHLVLVPRSSARIHDPADIARVIWETEGLHSATEQGARIAAISAFMRHHLTEDYGVDQRHIVDLPDGLVPADWIPQPVDHTILPPPARAGFLLSMGRATPYKGFDGLLDALGILRGQKVPLHHTVLAAVTDGSHRSVYQHHLARRIANEDLDVTLLTRFQPTIRALLWHHALRGIIVPSRAEPFGRIPLEAYAAGAAPVIATTAGGLTEQILDRDTGFTATPHDPTALAAAIQRAIALDQSARDQMQAAARAYARQRFDHVAAVHRFLNEPPASTLRQTA